MKSKYVKIALLVGCLGSCIAAYAAAGGRSESVSTSGNTTTKEFSLSGFDAVEASSAFKVEIRGGLSFKVIVTVDSDIFNRLKVQKIGRTLHIGLAPLSVLRLGGNSVLKAQVTMPRLTSLGLSGACTASLDSFSSSSDLRLELSGASRVTGDVDTGDLTVSLSGASKVTMSGNGGALTIDASGASTADFTAFSSKSADVELSGASEAVVNTNGDLAISASGASDLQYIGSPKITKIDTSGGASVKSR